MRNWVTVGLVAIGSLAIAGAAAADVPSELTSDVGCSCSADAVSGGASQALPLKCTISPSGGTPTGGNLDPSDDINVSVVVRNVLSAPLAGSTVVVTSAAFGGTTAYFDNGASPVESDEDPQTAVSALDGSANFVFDEGGVLIPAGQGGVANLDFAVTAAGPGPGGPVVLDPCPTDLTVHGYDLDNDAGGDCDLGDFGTFATYFTGGDLRGDFTHTAGVGLPDFGLFAGNFGADIDNQ
jgi:hypothetical protein